MVNMTKQNKSKTCQFHHPLKVFFKKRLQLAIFSPTLLIVEPLVFGVELVDIIFLSLFPQVVGSLHEGFKNGEFHVFQVVAPGPVM